VNAVYSTAELAAQLLKDAIRAGRLARRPTLATLNRIASVIGPVMIAQWSNVDSKKKIATASTSVAIQEVRAVAAARTRRSA